MSMKSDSLNEASIPLFCIYTQRWDVGGVLGLSTNRKREGITLEVHSMHPAKGDCPSQSCWKACVSVFVIEREWGGSVMCQRWAMLFLCVCLCVRGGCTYVHVDQYRCDWTLKKERYDLCTTQSDLLSTECLDMVRSLLRTWASSWIHSVWWSVGKPERSQVHHLSETSSSFWRSTSFWVSS